MHAAATLFASFSRPALLVGLLGSVIATHLPGCAPQESGYRTTTTTGVSPPPIVQQRSTRPPSKPSAPARLPDPAPGEPTSTGWPESRPDPTDVVPPATPTPEAPRTQPPVTSVPTTGVIPLEFHIQISTQEHLPAAKGLGATLVYPKGLPIFTDRARIVYEWRPDDGKEKRLNPRTNQPYGPIWKPTLAEQMEPENLARHLNTMEAWLISYVPQEFDGIVCLDVEAWQLKADEFHLGKPQQDDLARRAPGKKQSQLMGEFIRLTEARARELRPKVRVWGWWGMGGLHPAWPVWRPEQYNHWKTYDLVDDARALASIQAPMPVFYYPYMLDKAEDRRRAAETDNENWKAMYGAKRLARDGYAYLNSTHHDGPRKGDALTRAEFRECYEVAKSLGMRRFIVWGVIESPEARANIQRFLDQTLAPEVREIVAEDQRASSAPALDRSTPRAPIPQK